MLRWRANFALAVETSFIPDFSTEEFAMARYLRALTLTFAALFSSGALSSSICVGQTTPDQIPGDPVTGFWGAENSWQLTSVDLRTQIDNVSPRVRTERNRYWKPQLQVPKDLERQGLKMLNGIALYGGNEVPEVPNDAGAIWVVAAFDHYSVFPLVPDGQTSPEDLLLYTEMSFSVKNSISGSQPSTLLPGTSFQVDLPGGRIKLASGKVVSWRLFREKYSVQPKHTYLMEVLPLPGNLFDIAQRWDVTTGKVVPDTPGEIERAKAGAAKISGMTIQDALSYLSTVIAANQQ